MKWLLLACALLPIAQAHDIGAQVTWSREISRLFDRHCTSCHRDGGSAFSLATYPQAKGRAKEIAKSVLERRMPPFGAVKGFSDLRDDESLTQEQIELISLWVRAGAPEGDATLAPKPLQQPAKADSSPLGPEWDGNGKLASARTFVAIRPRAASGESIRVVAQLPDGSAEPLIWLYRYDPKLARTYFFNKPITLPAGTRIVSSSPGAMVALVEPAR